MFANFIIIVFYVMKRELSYLYSLFYWKGVTYSGGVQCVHTYMTAVYKTFYMRTRREMLLYTYSTERNKYFPYVHIHVHLSWSVACIYVVQHKNNNRIQYT